MTEHQRYMRESLRLAEEGFRCNETPVGAVVVKDETIVGCGRNQTEETGITIEHAEIVAIRDACINLAQKRLDGCSLYVTLEPCPMCAGAIILARFSRLFFGAYDLRAGATGTLYTITTDSRLNHQVETHGGVLDEECGELLRKFFEEKRL